LRVHLSRATLYLELGKYAQARDDALFVQVANPEDIQASFVLWRALTQLGDPVGAKEALKTVSDRLSDITDEALMREPYLLRIAAVLAFGKGDIARADEYVTRFRQLNPNDTGMRRLMGQIKFLIGDTKSAIEILFPLHKQDPDDLDVMFTLGQAYMQIGHYSEASGVFKRAAELAPNNSTLTAQLALSQVGLGAWDEALNDLQHALGDDAPDGDSTALLLTILQLKRGEIDAAYSTIKNLCEKSPNNLKAKNLLGMTQASLGDNAGATATFEAIAAAAPDYIPAQYNLAKFELAGGNDDAAVNRLEQIAEKNPDAAEVLTLLADIEMAREDLKAAVRWLDKAVAAAPDAIRTQVRLVELRLKLKQLTAAMSAARKLFDRNPENALAVETFAKTLAMRGRREDAIRHFRSAARYAGYDGAQLMRIAREQVALEDIAQAKLTLLKAINTSAKDEAAQALVRLDAQTGEFDAANKRLEEMRAAHPADPVPDVLTGEIHLRRQKFPEAIGAFEAAQQKSPTTTAVIGLADAHARGGELAKAIAVLESWVADHAADV
ncbi:MAG: tetratricopeptide repeat protein, partial [Gammaproteobacteria bacterium]